MGRPATVCVNDNLASSETGVCCGTTDVELTGWINYNLRSFEHISRHDLLDNLLCDSFSDNLICDFRIVLS